MIRPRLCLTLCAALSSLMLSSIGAADSKTPNVLFILTDDQGWNDAHFAGHPYVKTPHLDKFASQSTWFKQFYVAATVCSPSRTAFMTGHSPARHAVHGHFSTHEQNAARSMPDWLDSSATTLPDLLKTAGYTTGHFGKWHLGSGAGAPEPGEYGIDVYKTVNANGPQLGDEGKDPYFRARSTSLIVDETIKFIKDSQKQGKPFYANVWTLLPHAHLNPTPEQLKEYESLAPRADDPAFGPWMQKYLANAKDLKSQMQVFCASLTDLDTQMGRLFAALDELKLTDDTIIFYSSDNGAEDYRIGNASNAGVGNTGPLRARKRSMYEGGIRTFGLLRWPGHVAAGRVEESTVTGGVDFLPTICKLAGVTVPENIKPDGEDVSDIWLGAVRPRTRPLFWEWLFRVQGEDYTPPTVAIRDGDWKLFVNHNGTGAQLYNIPKDIGEARNVAAEHPEIVKDLLFRANAWHSGLPASPARTQVLNTGKAGDEARPQAGAKAKGKAKAGAPAPDRKAIFRQKDSNHDGRLSKEEYLNRFPDQAEGNRRFPTFDTDGDGVLTEEEFVRAGRK